MQVQVEAIKNIDTVKGLMNNADFETTLKEAVETMPISKLDLDTESGRLMALNIANSMIENGLGVTVQGVDIKGRRAVGTYTPLGNVFAYEKAGEIIGVVPEGYVARTSRVLQCLVS